MRAYSMELRLAVLAARDSGLGTKEVAEKYNCSRAWVRRVVQQRRELGKYGPYKLRLRNRRGRCLRERTMYVLVEEPRITAGELERVLGVELSDEDVFAIEQMLDINFGVAWSGLVEESAPVPVGNTTPTMSKSQVSQDLDMELHNLNKEA
jgi:transposase